MKRGLHSSLAGCLLVAGLASPSWGQDRVVDPGDMPGPLKKVGVEQNLGNQLPEDLLFVDSRGREVVLGQLLGERPILLTFVYYECPMLCSLIMNGLTRALGVMTFEVGEAFDVVAVSIDPGETPAMAAEAKVEALARYERPATADGWHFLTGSQASIETLAQTAGFAYEYIPETGEYAHASAVLVVTPDGRIAQYFLGVEFSPKDLRLALVEASENRLGNVIDQVLLYCFRYDPTLGKYTAVTMRILRITGILFVLGLLAFVWLLRKQERSASQLPRPKLGAA